MDLKQRTRSRGRAVAARVLHRYGLIHRGNDVFADIDGWLPHLRFRTVFDVGAHLGESASVYLKRFPDARVHSFEPVKANYEQLRVALAGEPRAVPVNAALGDADATASIALHEASHMASLGGDPGPGAEDVQVRTLDGYCEAEGIASVDYLKIDTEGHDLKVLEGAAGMLSAGRIALVEVEAGMSPENERQVPLETLKAHLEAAGYFVFGFYSQFEEWPTGRPHLRRADVVFVSATTSAENRRSPSPAAGYLAG